MPSNLRGSIRGIGTSLRKTLKKCKRDRYTKEPATRREDFVGLRRSALEVAQLATKVCINC